MSENLSDFTGTINPETVSVNGIELQLKEFDMKTRALWLDVAEEFSLSDAQFEIQSKVIPKISGISTGIESDPRIKSIQAKISKLEKNHDELIELYATPDEPEDIDEQLESIIIRMEKEKESIAEIAKRIESEIFDEAKYAEKAVADFMELQDKARVNFVWRIAKHNGETDKEFDEFFNECSGEDYEMAERYVEQGNERWASLYSNRIQRKPKSQLKN